MHKNKGAIYYSDYLMLDQFLNCQSPLSRKWADSSNPEAHDEMLFIIVHQAYELWFKQILHELNSILAIFAHEPLRDSDLGTIVQRLDRICKIQLVIGSQLEILETMTPMDFLEFRNLLVPASGFQSTQFREIEIKLGLHSQDRQAVDRDFFLGRLREADRSRLIDLESQSTLLQELQSWLERTPFTITADFSFWTEYQKAINAILSEDAETLKSNIGKLSDSEREHQLANLEQSQATFDSLFSEEAHQQLVQSGVRKLSRKAVLNALFIFLYREEPMLALPFQMLILMMNIDENFTTWRYRHALMAQRMLGSKLGTGGSSGHQYLKRAADNNRVFIDLFNLSTFLIPRSRRPSIPDQVRKQLNFHV
jgi:tryptophan 2,3-dioxygenase